MALNDAQIEEIIDMKMEQCNEDTASEKKPLQQGKTESNPSNDSGVGEMQLSDTEIIKVQQIHQNNICNIFTAEPPPLIPLESVNKTEETNTILELPKDTPPLIPIKPILDVSTVLTNVIDPNPLKLQCNNCMQLFDNLSELKGHKSKVCQQNSLQCNICRKEFKESKKLIGHLKGHMVVKDYKCKLCGKCYPNNSTFQVHMRSHTGEKPFKCEKCNKGFVRWGGVLGHMKTHEAHKPYKCETCGKTFKISSNLERHKVLHMDILPYCCSYCGKTFSQSDNLLLHIRSYHTKERPYLCNVCGKGFVSSSRLTRHMWVHTGFKPYQCQHCTKAYSNLNDLRSHMRLHVGTTGQQKEDRPYVCTYPSCKMRFYHACRLARHLKIHEKAYTCPDCHKRFSTLDILNKHVKNKHVKDVEYLEEVIVDREEGNNIFVNYE